MVWHWRGSTAGPAERERSTVDEGAPMEPRCGRYLVSVKASDSRRHPPSLVIDDELGVRHEVPLPWMICRSLAEALRDQKPSEPPEKSRAERHWLWLWLLDVIAYPSKPSEAPGATIDSDEGVGIGSEEKVSQDGSTEAREGFVGGPDPGWYCPECGCKPCFLTALDRHRWWREGEGPWWHAHGKRLVPCLHNELRPDPDLLSQLHRRETNSDTNKPPYSLLYTCSHQTKSSTPCPICQRLKDRPPELCTPAPPPPAEPAEETFFGGESYGGDTAQGASKTCRCLPMQIYRTVFPVPTRATIKKHPDDDGTELPTERFCRWCGARLDRDTRPVEDRYTFNKTEKPSD